MARFQISLKREAINKATKSIFSVLVGSAIVTVFALAGSRSLIGQLRYQNKVIGAKKQALTQLKANKEAADSLLTSYKAFESSPESIIGTADKNSKIVLDALPSKYDFPALITSLSELAKPYGDAKIGGSDDEINQQKVGASQVVEIPFELSVTASYISIQQLINDLDRSIRPFRIVNLKLTGGEEQMTVEIKAHTYFQSEKKLEIKTKVLE